MNLSVSFSSQIEELQRLNDKMRVELEQRRKKDFDQSTRVRDLENQSRIQQRVILQQKEELRQLRAFKAFTLAKCRETTKFPS